MLSISITYLLLNAYQCPSLPFSFSDLTTWSASAGAFNLILFFQVIPDKLAVQIKFSSVGSGHFPIHYAFYLHFTAGSGGADAASGELADIETECWDNNVIFQIPLAKEMARFRVGLNPGDLREKLFRSEKLESSRTLSLKVRYICIVHLYLCDM